MNKFLLITCVLSANLVLSQIGAMYTETNALSFRDNVAQNGVWITKNSSNHNNLKGSPYLFESWSSPNASLHMANNKTYGISSINYNIDLERFEAKFSEDSILAINPRNIKKIVVNNRTFKRYFDAENQRNTYFEEELVTSTLTLLKKYETSITEGIFNPLTQQKTSDDKLIIRERYFYTMDNETLIPLKLKKSAILKSLDSNKIDALTEYAKDNDLSFRDINDVKKILIRYNTL